MPPKPAQVSEPTQKPALVLVHGFRGSPLGLKTIADDLRQAGYAVYMPALPPFAGAKFKTNNAQLENDNTNPPKPESKSPKSKTPIANLENPKAYAKYLHDYLQEKNLVRPILIGHSMGSIVVAATAQRYPELISQKLILLSPISTKPPRFIARISPLANYLPTKVVDYVTTRFLFVPRNQQLFHETLNITHQCSSDQPPSKSELSNAMKFSTSYSVADFLDGLQKDIVMIAGAKDRLISQKDTQELAKRHSTTLELIPGSGHLHNYEKPHETATLILKHLD